MAWSHYKARRSAHRELYKARRIMEYNIGTNLLSNPDKGSLKCVAL
ncbi:MAG: hypothetical protein KDD51_02440 [Bdellovibrionales bacterium]|nr:hypothetical protein [Bdellovibrionales bacterium]